MSKPKNGFESCTELKLKFQYTFYSQNLKGRGLRINGSIKLKLEIRIKEIRKSVDILMKDVQRSEFMEFRLSFEFVSTFDFFVI